jgi:hypothetical protein
MLDPAEQERFTSIRPGHAGRRPTAADDHHVREATMRGVPPLPTGHPVDHPVASGLCAAAAVACAVQFLRTMGRARRAAEAGNPALARQVERRAMWWVAAAFVAMGMGMAL